MIKIEIFSPMLGDWNELGSWRKSDWRGALNAALANAGRAEKIRLTDAKEQYTYTWGQAVVGQIKEGDVLTLRVLLWMGEKVDRQARYVVQKALPEIGRLEGDLQYLDGDQVRLDDVELELSLFTKGVVVIQEVDRLNSLLPLR